MVAARRLLRGPIVEPMSLDLTRILAGWDYEPGKIKARLCSAKDGRDVVQLRLDLGVLQLEAAGRPDGVRPHGSATYLDYLRREAEQATDGQFEMSSEQCLEADQEFLQFYQRRLCWLSLKEYARAVTDADHTLAFMDFVKRYSPSAQYTLAHEQYRGFVLFHRTQAATAVAVEQNRPEDAVDMVRDARKHLKAFYEEYRVSDDGGDDEISTRLSELEQELRQHYKIRTTLREKLDSAVANEQYELAARLRDEIRTRAKEPRKKRKS
jgi:hypothetical protein